MQAVASSLSFIKDSMGDFCRIGSEGELNGQVIVPIGLRDNSVVVENFASIPSSLITGTTGSGKSAFVKTFIAEIMEKYSPEQVRFAVFDSRGVDYGFLNTNPFMLIPVVNDVSKATGLIQWALLEARKRMNMLERIDEFAHLFLIFDDFGELSPSSDTFSDLIQLFQIARRTKLHVWIVTSTPSSNDSWELIDIFADEGLSGMKAENRVEFQRMIVMCEHKQIDLIITKSVSRFARNVKEALEYVRKLKLLGIGIQFEKEGIFTLALGDEMLLNTFTAIAQEESKSISQNQRLSIVKRMERGEYVDSNAPYGFRLHEKKLAVYDQEADIVRYVFHQYLSGWSTSEIARDLTEKGIQTKLGKEQWRSKKIDNAKYTGSDVYDPIIDEDIFEEAAAAKAARQRNQVINECEGIALMRDRIRCGVCGAPMVRHICSKRKVKESWTCANDVCGCRVRISDSDLLMKVTLLMNRIIENADLMVPKPKKRFKDSLTVQRLQGEIDDELAHDQPSEKLIVTRIREIASQLYQETNAKDQIAARIAQKRVTLMSPQAEFNTAYFTDLVENVVLEAPARVTLITKTDVHISEGEPDYGSQENTQEDGDAN